MEHNPTKILVVTGKKNRVKEFNLSRKRLFWSVGTVFAVLLAIFSMAVFLTTQVLYYSQLEKLQGNNDELVSVLDEFSQNIVDLDAEMSSLHEKDKALRAYMDLPLVDSDIQKVGIGGARSTKMASMDLLVPEHSAQPSALNFDVNKLKREIELEKISLQEISEQINRNADFFKHVPSIRPVQTGYVSSSYGYRADPFTKRRKFHKGIDIVTRKGTPIYATGDGVIKYARYFGGFGKSLKINHGYGYSSIYAHLSKYFVKSGEKVTRGQIIGEVGNTGRSSGAHLHYEVRVKNKPTNPFDYFMQDNL